MVEQTTYPQWMVDGKPLPLRAVILRRRAARRTSVGSWKPAIHPGDCGGCGGWGVVRSSGVRCSRCDGTGHALKRPAPRDGVAS